MTLRHIVSWKLNGETLEERDAQVARATEALEALPAKVSQIRALSVHKNELNEGTNFDLTLIVDLDDEQALREYAVHPEHLLVVDLMKQIVAVRAVTDFTV